MSDLICKVALNAKLGDGCIVHQGHVNCYMTFTSTNIQLLSLKREMCSKYHPTNFREVTSGYAKGQKGIYVFRTRSYPEITKVYHMTYEECIDHLDISDLVMWYLDDGSYHQRKHFIHLYCNMLSENQASLLSDKIHELFPNRKRPTIRWDSKKDGRKYVYLYFPADLSRAFKEHVKEFIITHGLDSLAYKVGGLDTPSTTIETAAG